MTQVFDAVDNRYEFSGNQDIDAVLFGTKWTTTNLTYSFPTDAAFYQTPYYDQTYLDTFEVLNTLQKAGARYALSLVYGYTLLSFTEVTESATTHGNIRIAQNDSSNLESAEANFPGSETWDGDIWMGKWGNEPFYETPQIGNWGQATLLHEIGHSLGLKHGHSDYTTLDLTIGGYIDGPGPRYGTRALPAAHDGWAWSLMTYRSSPSVGDPSFQGDAFNQPQTFMQNDIAALQYMYGAYFGHNASNSTYTFNNFTGEMFINGVSQGMPAQDSLRNNGGKIFRTIWDGNGIDTYDFSNFTGNQTIDLAPGGWSMMNAAQLADLYPLYFENPTPPGNVANALLYNNDTRSLIENANGGSGNDFLFGNLANNALHGNGGNDQLLSGDGHDSLFGGTGNDTLSAAVGDDSLSGEGGNDYLDGATGNDTIYAGLDQDAAVGGIGNDYIDGEDGDDTLSGDDGNDYLNGGTGIDSLTGGSGNDSFVVDSVFDVVVELNGGGIDLVYASVNFTLASHFENLTLLGSVGFSATGNAANNLIYGNSGGNQLNGAGGFDTVYGLGGDDVISSSSAGYYDAGTGNDTVYAGSGSNETLIGGDGIDFLDATGTTGAYDINLNTGATSFAGESFTGFEHVNSGSGNNAITGNGANNTINSNAGNDTVYAEGGSDIVNGGAGDDSLRGGTGSDILTAGTYASAGDVLYGDDGNDALTSSGAGTYDGGTGNDTLTAGLGSNETLIGGADTDLLNTASYSGAYNINLATG
ncbi:hemolysin-type calcium-binding repeat 2 copies family protein [Asticcacaulis biprosthecium C19]|uniref:Hemolysin-type calcium-binding repeat 2 copies family protein n=1 Tax=Asticcacaulis biprosthecium C19 TaxID=715226 RepID=F4QM33_9CAUL|nr:hemolysin-type calcium-binding repeat 2 copies family protein [Asticcacaulis biprosthecium C19]